jgi:hypothetical protein
MKSRNGVSFVPSDHNDVGSAFYRISLPISPPNNAVDIGDWVPNPNAFGAEAPRTAEQCRHVDGSTMGKLKSFFNTYRSFSPHNSYLVRDV